VSVGFVAPSVTPRSESYACDLDGKQIHDAVAGQPAFKVYEVDRDTYEIMDAKVYISELVLNISWHLIHFRR
jgi:sphingomyelin phosphodiesterase